MSSPCPVVPARRPVRALVAIALLLVSATWASPGRAPDAPGGRVILVSLDGLGAATLADDPVATELTRLKDVAARGVHARGLQPHTPSTTANTHAALWTGAWGDVNGITGNTMPMPPRAAHTVVERASGFRADHLRAEPIWVTAARQGVRTVVQQASQSYPFLPASVGHALPAPPIVLNGYQTRVLSAPRVLQSADVTRVPCMPGSSAPASCIEWTAGAITFRGRFEADAPGQAISRVSITSPGARASVEARAVPVEQDMPRGRPLARHFSEGLLVDAAPDTPPIMVYFRLFEVSADAGDFVLYQPAIHELALHDGTRDTRADVLRLLREAGGFTGNAAGYQWERPESPLGVAIAKGGDGTSERRYLETVELGVRQSIAHSRWLWRTFAPRLFVAYTSFPDELDHRFLALGSSDARYVPFRRWGYQLVDLTVAALADLVTTNDHIVFVSDHGLAPVTHEVKVAVALQAAGLLTLDASGRIDAARSEVVPMRNCLIVNGTDWKDGLVPPASRGAVLRQAAAALRRLVDPETGRAIVTDVVSTAAEQRALGFGGVNGADACFGLAEGYAVDETSMQGPLVTRRRLPKGDHNFLGTRPEMQGILIAAGPRLQKAQRWPALRAIDVAPLVSDLLAISPPADATGLSPLSHR